MERQTHQSATYLLLHTNVLNYQVVLTYHIGRISYPPTSTMKHGYGQKTLIQQDMDVEMRQILKGRQGYEDTATKIYRYLCMPYI